MEQYLWYSDRIQTVEKSGAEDISYVPWLGRLRTTMTHSTIWILVLFKVFWTQDTAGIYNFSQIQVLKTIIAAKTFIATTIELGTVPSYSFYSVPTPIQWTFHNEGSENDGKFYRIFSTKLG